MQEFIVVILVAFLVLGVLRRFLFFSSYRGFQKSAEDFVKKQQQAQRKPEGTVTIHQTKKNVSSSDDGEYVDYEEIK